MNHTIGVLLEKQHGRLSEMLNEAQFYKMKLRIKFS